MVNIDELADLTSRSDEHNADNSPVNSASDATNGTRADDALSPPRTLLLHQAAGAPAASMQ